MQGCWLPVSLPCLIIYLIIVVVVVEEGEELSATVTRTVGQLTAMAEIRDQTRVAVAASIRLLALRFQFGATHNLLREASFHISSYTLKFAIGAAATSVAAQIR